MVTGKKIGGVFIVILGGTVKDQVFRVSHKFGMIALDEIEEPVVAITTRDDRIRMLGKDTVTDLIGSSINIILEVRSNVAVI